MADIVLINPKFEVSYWGMEYALPYVGKRANLPVAALPLIAALTPAEHTITLIDENVEPIDFNRCARADIVGVTGMSVQRFQMTEILTKLKDRGCFTVVGGPCVTVRRIISATWPMSSSSARPSRPGPGSWPIGRTGGTPFATSKPRRPT